MIYVQYLNWSTGYGNKGIPELIEACGDRAIVILDGRNNKKTWIRDAIKFNENPLRMYPGFRIYKGGGLDSKNQLIFEHLGV